MVVTRARNQLPSEFDLVTLTPKHFHVFYSVFIRLRFPLKVAEVLELRSLVNHAVDDFTEPPLTPNYRQFRESLEKAIDSFSIETPHHRERLLKTLTLIRDLHVAHALESRYVEERLKIQLTDNNRARRRAVQKGMAYLAVTVFSVFGWFVSADIDWAAKALSVLCALQTWSQFRSLPMLERQEDKLNAELNNVLRDRVNAINWKILIHKFALVLGYKHIKGVDVFHADADPQDTASPYH